MLIIVWYHDTITIDSTELLIVCDWYDAIDTP